MTEVRSADVRQRGRRWTSILVTAGALLDITFFTILISQLDIVI